MKLTDAEMSQHAARLSEACPELQITTELVLDHRVFIARGKNGVSPWIVLSSDLERFEAAIAPSNAGSPGARAGLMTPTQSSRPDQRWFTVVDGQRLRRLRRRHGLSQEQLADRAGISLSTMRRLERQPAASCRCRTLGRLAGAMGEDPACLTPATQP